MEKEQTMLLWVDSEHSEVYKFVVRTHELIAQQGRNWVVNISIGLLAVRSWRHPVVTSGYILGLPCNATSSANANAVEHYHVLFKNVFYSGFLLWKPCFTQKSVYTFEKFMLHWGKPTMN